MNDQLSDKIYIEPSSEKLITVCYRQVQAMAIIFVCASVFSVLINITHVVKYYPVKMGFTVEGIFFKVYPFYSSVELLLGLMQIYLIYKAVRSQKKALEQSDQLLFNRSFEYYKNGNKAALAVVSMTLITELFIFYKEVWLK